MIRRCRRRPCPLWTSMQSRPRSLWRSWACSPRRNNSRSFRIFSPTPICASRWIAIHSHPAAENPNRAAHCIRRRYAHLQCFGWGRRWSCWLACRHCCGWGRWTCEAGCGERRILFSSLFYLLSGADRFVPSGRDILGNVGRGRFEAEAGFD